MMRPAATSSKANAGRSPASTPCVEVSESSTLPLGNGSTTTSPTATAASTNARSLRRLCVCIRLGISPTVPAHVSCGRTDHALTLNAEYFPTERRPQIKINNGQLVNFDRREGVT